MKKMPFISKPLEKGKNLIFHNAFEEQPEAGTLSKENKAREHYSMGVQHYPPIIYDSQ